MHAVRKAEFLDLKRCFHICVSKFSGSKVTILLNFTFITTTNLDGGIALLVINREQSMTIITWRIYNNQFIYDLFQKCVYNS